MATYRIMRGKPNERHAIGTMRKANSAREAVALDEATRIADEADNTGFNAIFGKFPVYPVVAVYELVKVPEGEWK